jgi:hypothetical protein
VPIYDSPKDDPDGRALARHLAAMSRAQEQAHRSKLNFEGWWDWPDVGTTADAQDVQPASLTRYLLDIR